ncbi:DUF6301 family protein [Cellulomonas xiejunii]|uniref:DUF6301 family protein n=1 Tax=Cellulomonas xiejunii TaxID=2968083 RepID=UPI001D0DD66B|nr:DUF6301 family protein [Cellulomonas xiejunii]MCC2314202.1 DUF6301 family protein [Cellulomonas xiejunii]
MHTASTDQVQGILRAFRRVAWPAGRRAALQLAVDCGWTVRRDGPRSVRYVTSLGTNDDIANALVRPDDADGSLLDVTVHVSDYAADDAPGLDRAYGAVVAAVQVELGSPVHVDDRAAHPRTVWDLDGGGRVAVQRLSAIVVLKLLSLEVADLERTEKLLGIDPGRIPGTGHEDL